MFTRTTIGLMLSAAFIVMSSAATQAQTSGKPASYVGSSSKASDISAQQQRRRVRVRVAPTDRPLSSSATRQCRAWYAPEYRASGTVITPRMQCWWDNG